MIETSIPTYIVNLKKRADRKAHILKEFSGRREFAINIIEPLPHKIGAVSLWITIKSIINEIAKKSDEYVLICEDDHQFTEFYTKSLLFNCIQEARQKGADFLSGGVHWFNNGLQVTDNLFWMDRFTATQFIIVFRPFFNTILEADFDENIMADHKISVLTHNKFCISPFISIQKDFGYSDATAKNNTYGGVMENLFAKSAASAQILNDVLIFYKKQVLNQTVPDSFEDISIPTYIINQSGTLEGREQIEKQFAGKNEFDINIIETHGHEKAAVSIWLSIRKIIENAIINEDDVIIICDDEHKFTEHYSKEFLIKNIIEAHQQGAEILLGSVGSFGIAVPITKSRAWLNHFYRGRFIILYQSVFQKVLKEPFDDNMKLDFTFSDCTSNKMMLFPFISVQCGFTQDDYMLMHDEKNELIESLLEPANTKLVKMYEAENKYQFSL